MGLVPWNAIAICEMSKTSWQMGKLLMKGDSGNHSKVQYLLLEQWKNINQFLQETSPDFTDLERKVHQEYFLEKMDASEIYPRRINAKEVLT